MNTHPRRTVVPTAQVPIEDLPLATPMPDTTHRQVEVYKPEVKLYSASIAKALLVVTRALSPVAKEGKNDFHKYTYPKWETVLEELGPKLAEHGLIIIQSEVAHGGFASDLIEVTYEFTIVHENGDIWPDRPRWTAICKVRDSKGVLDDKAASKCHTQAEKYALMKLFKIRTKDMDAEDHDNDRKDGNGKRLVPSTTGKLPPHEIVTIEGDTPASWSTRFLDKIKGADSDHEIGQWDAANDHNLNRLQQKSIETYNAVVIAMDKRRAEIAKGQPAQTAGQHPTEAATTTATAQPAKPKRVRPSRAKPKPDQQPAATEPPAETKPVEVVQEKPKPVFSDDERDWLSGLGGAFSGCEDRDSLDAEGERLMDPWQGKVTDDAWQAAVDLYQEHVERLTPEAQQ